MGWTSRSSGAALEAGDGVCPSGLVRPMGRRVSPVLHPGVGGASAKAEVVEPPKCLRPAGWPSCGLSVGATRPPTSCGARSYKVATKTICIYIHAMHMHILTYTRIHIHIDRQTDRQAGRQEGRHAGRQIDR